MTYRIIETPDHLHRGIHIFAAANLITILSWLDTQIRNNALQEYRLLDDEKWFLTSIKDHGLTPEAQHRRLLARKEAQEFFKKHPEMRKGATYRTTPYPSQAFTSDDPDQEIKDSLKYWWQDYLEFEYCQDLHGNPEVTDTIENLRSAINSKTISAITDELSSLTEILSESGFQHRFVYDALSILNELFATGASNTSRYLDSDTDEAFEVTNLCHGEFRKLASNSIQMLRTMTPTDFECLCAELIGQFGLTDVCLTPIVADGGVDVVAFQILDGERIKYIVQCKRNSAKNKVDVRVVREIAGVKMDLRADHALLITTSEFTKPARDFAKRSRSYPWGVRLLDHKLLKHLLDCTD